MRRRAIIEQIVASIARVLVDKDSPESIMEEVIDFRLPYQTLYYCFDNGLPPA